MMTPSDTEERQAELNDLIEVFERAFAEHDDVCLAEFLPAQGHSLYLETRRELLRVDLELCWNAGKCHRIQDYVQQFPDLLEDRATLQEVAFEEYRLRTLAGEAPSRAEYEEKYGVDTKGWPSSKVQPPEPIPADEQAADVDLLINLARRLGESDSWHNSCHGDVAQALLRENAPESSAESAFLLAQAMTAMPEIGSTFLNFRLIAELGRGSFGRVYLARQGDLANRLVALKITVDLLGEEQKLAQLQHTNVVPIYSAHQAGPLQAVCMPYFGSTTLADVIRELPSRNTARLTGKDIVHTLRSRKKAFQAHVPARKEAADSSETGAEADALLDRSTTLKVLEESSYQEAVLYIAECVTEGLIHAHERGILHRDLKPANILLTDEGRPMLVDFNLSADTKLHAGLYERQVGGTLPYMAPEYLEAMQGSSRTADARSDLYSLGVVLFELLTGRLPFEARAGHLSEILPPMIAERRQEPPSLRRWNPAVSPAVESMVRQCLQPDPARRYQSAKELHEDLMRQRRHQPLRYAPEPSVRERAQKWVRRHPRLASPSTVGGILIFLVLGSAAPYGWQAWEQWQEDIVKARQAQEKSTTAIARAEQADEKSESAAKAARASQAQIDALNKFREFEKTSASSRSIMEIISVMQMLPEAWPYEEKRLARAASDCRRSLRTYLVLEDENWQRQPGVRDLPAPERDRLRRKVAELLYALAAAEQTFLSRLRDPMRNGTIAKVASTLPGFGREIWGAWETAVKARCLAAAKLNEQACACFSGKTTPWYLAQQKLALSLLGNDGKGTGPFAVPAELQGDEGYWAAGKLIAEDQFKKALPLLDEATKHSPDHAGAWLLLAWCHYNLMSPQPETEHALKAKSCYESYLRLRPDGVWGHYNLGLLFLETKFWSRAESDFSKVLARYPDLALAYVHRAAARKGMRKNLKAIEDLDLAIQLAPEVPEYYFLRSQRHSDAGNLELAEADRRRVLIHEPHQYIGWLFRGTAKYKSDPKGALADFEKALALNPVCPLTLFNKACLLSDVMGRPREAVDVLTKVVELEPQLLDARFRRGMLLARAGQRDKAVEDAERLILSEPTPARYYDAASIYALTSRSKAQDSARALQFLSHALRHGYGVNKYQTDDNLRPLANLKEFRVLARGLELLGAGAPPAALRP